MNRRNKILITGPCSAETEEQVLTTAKELQARVNFDYYRAGIWKPRTSPGSFEGVGEVGLPWLNKVQDLGIKVCTEVATAAHVEQCLKYNIDALWIGARTTVNPFYVQEIADAIKGSDIPVFVKNPINPDLKLWMGAIQRLQNVGVKKIWAIHRGFSLTRPSKYRNEPLWNIPIKFKQEFPDVPVICDPSHICGNRPLLQSVAQKAIDLDMDGLFIESHINPAEAWSDASQQVTPEDLKFLLDNIVVRDKEFKDPIVISALEQLRQEIDLIDEELIQLLSSRMQIVQKIGEYKKENHVTILQIERWKKIWHRVKQLAIDLDLGTDFAQRIYDEIHATSIQRQTDIMYGKNNQELEEESEK